MSEPTTYSSLAIANRFLELASQEGERLSNMKLQKLVFLAHGFHLGLTDEPLTSNNVHAWQWGPVMPLLYKKLQKFANGDVTEQLPAQDQIPPGSLADRIIERIWQRYKTMTASKLSNLTHLPGSPWDQVWNEEGNKFGVIPVQTIRDYYAGRLQNA